MFIPKNINESIQYQEGSVVSREILRKQSATITLFAFDKGQGLSEHASPYDVLLIVTDGNVEITVSGDTKIVKTNEYITISENEPHALKAVDRFKMMLVMIR